ncbi:Protein-glutamate methylesterase family protein [Rhodovulum sp. P5]|uniref:LptA/OstA family protein n=1 Tax=Rhodovulum sp. P5 TaxID=1564506 RepID=UPI0009C2709C|nr:LptA/OstA family protein [Rhodovulum sp. P5]ARE40707.1 Protein-glutamate methylesterase family protein [Rhodovulum sp. P5]
MKFGSLEHDSTQPIEITSEQLDVDQAAGTVLFTGDVFATQGNLRLQAEEITVFYADDSAEGNRIDRVEADGSVVLVLNEEAAEGDFGVYRVADGVVEMSGNVLLTQGPGTVAGDKLVVNLGTGIGRMEGRVRTVLRPEGTSR